MPAPHAMLCSGPQVPAPEEPLPRAGGGLVRLCLSRVQHAAPTNLRGQVALPQRAQGPSLERQLGHLDPKTLVHTNPAKDSSAEVRTRQNRLGGAALGLVETLAWQGFLS